MISEGGTSYNHMVTIARSDSPWGPFEACPHNPILTHRNRPEHPVQALGHADLVETPAGWWAVFLGIRPQGGQFHHLGRETYLAPVTWSDDGWPTIGDGRHDRARDGGAASSRRIRGPQTPTRDEFDGEAARARLELPAQSARRRLVAHRAAGLLAAQRLEGDARATRIRRRLSGGGRRGSRAARRRSWSSNRRRENEEAGLVVRGNDANHFDLGRHAQRRPPAGVLAQSARRQSCRADALSKTCRRARWS